jgi:hypothetical protein
MVVDVERIAIVYHKVEPISGCRIVYRNCENVGVPPPEQRNVQGPALSGSQLDHLALDCRRDGEEEHRPDGMTTLTRRPEPITLFA